MTSTDILQESCSSTQTMLSVHRGGGGAASTDSEEAAVGGKQAKHTSLFDGISPMVGDIRSLYETFTHHLQCASDFRELSLLCFYTFIT